MNQLQSIYEMSRFIKMLFAAFTQSHSPSILSPMDLSSEEQLEEDLISSPSLNPSDGRYSSMSIESSQSKLHKSKQSNRICQRELTELIVEAIRTEQNQTINKIMRRIQSTNRFSEQMNSGSLKRRVYDCINVMVASGMVNKNNTKVSFNSNSGFIKRQERKITQDKVFISNLNIMDKQAKISQMRNQYKVYRSIFHKNIANHSKQESDKIKPPFCAVITNENEKFNFKSKLDCFILISCTPFIPYGDSQIFMMLKEEINE